jgi:hypothetical protein
MSGSSPPLELKWFAITRMRRPLKSNVAASGLRLFAHATFAGRCGRRMAERYPPIASREATVGVVASPVPTVPDTKVTRAGS